MRFVHLHAHSHFSFLYGASPVEELVSSCAKKGMEALALTDRDGLYAAVPFFEAARTAGIKPLIGTELPVDFPSVETGRKSGRLVLIARDEGGYSNLCRLVTDLHLGAPRESVSDTEGKGGSLPIERLFRHSNGLIVLCSEPDMLPLLHPVFEKSLYAEILNDGTRKCRLAMEVLIERAHGLGIPCVATNAVTFARREDHHLHLLMNAIRLSRPLARLPPEECAGEECYLKSPEEMAEAFSCYPYTLAPEAIPMSALIAEECVFRFRLGELLFPTVEVPPGESPFSHLAKLCLEGASRRYRPLSPEALSRLHRELDTIEKLGFTSYFLTVHEIVNFCRERGIKAAGRGSAAGSAVAYALGITSIDPIEHDLYFERFLSPGREDPPDIDLDISWRRRDEVIDYIYRRFGKDRVAMICTYATMKSRMAVRDVARALGLAPEETSRLARLIPRCRASEIKAAAAAIPYCRELEVEEEPYRTILEMCARLDGFPRHLSVHPGGVVISNRPLVELVPLERAAKGVVITQYNMGPIERLGLLKIDVLGQRGLSVIEDSAASAERATGRRVELDSLPRDDRKTFNLLREGRTLGVFQIESPGMRSLLRAMKPQSVDDLTLAIALIRPGASGSGMKELFLLRRAGLEPVLYLHPALQSILAESFGTFVYQEQVMRAAAAVAGFSLSEADELRRAMTHKRSLGRMEAIKERFVAGALERGIPSPIALAIFSSLAKFAGYGFPKAHAATYAEFSYQAAYLKAHYPAEFMAAVLCNDAGFYHHSTYIEEAKRLGVPVALPDINRSEEDYSLKGGVIYIGLSRVKGVKSRTVRSILSARAEFSFTSLADFMSRVEASHGEIESLIKCGAFDSFENTRPELLWKLSLLKRTRDPGAPVDANTSRPSPLFNALKASPPSPLPRLPDYSPEEKLLMEMRYLEASISSHPLEILVPDELSKATAKATEIERLKGEEVTVIGWVIARRRAVTRSGRYMQFVSLQDLDGDFEVILLPEEYEKFGAATSRASVLLVKGRIREHAGVPSVVATEIEPLISDDDVLAVPPRIRGARTP